MSIAGLDFVFLRGPVEVEVAVERWASELPISIPFITRCTGTHNESKFIQANIDQMLTTQVYQAFSWVISLHSYTRSTREVIIVSVFQMRKLRFRGRVVGKR